MLNNSKLNNLCALHAYQIRTKKLFFNFFKLLELEKGCHNDNGEVIKIIYEIQRITLS